MTGTVRGGTLDDRSDQFSFAATLWLALCRDFPYDPASRDADARRPHRAPPERLSPALIACLRRALAPNPDARFSSMTALLDELRGIEVERPAPPVFVAPQAPPSYGTDSEAYVLGGYPSASASIPEIPTHDLSARPAGPAPRAWGRWWQWSGLTAALGGLATTGYLAATWRDADSAQELAADPAVRDDEPASPEDPLAHASPSSSPEFPILAPPPTCAIPAEVDGQWSFSAVETRGELIDKVGRYDLEIRVDGCTVQAALAKTGFDIKTYAPPLRDEGPLAFSTVAPFTGRLVGAFRPRVPWDTGAYAYEFTFFVNGRDLYGSYRARGSRQTAGLLRGYKQPKSAPTAPDAIRARQPCLTLCELNCSRAQCASRCASSDPWASPACSNR